MTIMMRRSLNQKLTNVNGAAAIDHDFSQGLVSHDHLPERNESEKAQPINAGLDGLNTAR